MKLETKLLIGGVIVIIGILGLGKISSTMEVVNDKEVETVIEKETVNELEEKIKEAVASSTPAIEKKAQDEYDSTVEKLKSEYELALAKASSTKAESIASGIKAVEDKVKIDYIREVEKTIEDQSYWRAPKTVKRLINEKAEKYGVSASLMTAIISCESGFNPSIQSNHVYTERNVPKGYKVGDREQSFGLVQIHLPAHQNVTKEQANDPDFATDFLAKNIAAGRVNMWSCAKNLAMR